MTFHSTDKVRLVIPKAALVTVFDECDGFDQDETGGRIIGTYQDHGDKLDIHITGIIEAGPRARRSAVSFFQDGAYQEQLFRKLEEQNREIEHLGNWHTHHVNGLQHLSDGDIETYYRTVNHQNHNAPFFYALLVTSRNRSSDPLRRYTAKHYLFRRGDERIYELHGHQLEIVERPLVWPLPSSSHPAHRQLSTPASSHARPERAQDNDIIQELYPGIRPYSSPQLGVYWRGALDLVDGSKVQVVILEDVAGHAAKYSATLRDAPTTVQHVADELARVEFSSARAALVATERACNRAIYQRTYEQHHKSST